MLGRYIRHVKAARLSIIIGKVYQPLAYSVPAVFFGNKYGRYPRVYFRQRIIVRFHKRCHANDCAVRYCGKHSLPVRKSPVFYHHYGVFFYFFPRKVFNEVQQLFRKLRILIDFSYFKGIYFHSFCLQCFYLANSTIQPLSNQPNAVANKAKM